MRGRWLLVGATAGALLAIPAQATAGGSWLETDERYYAPGDAATARGTFGPGQLEGDIADGPYHAYLVPGFRWFEKPGPIPGYAVPLGPIAIRPATGNYCCWVATLRFTVPDVPPGRYSIEYCNDPCTVNGIGDLMGGSFFVGETQEEARLMGRIERLERKVDTLQRTKRDLRKAEAELAQVQEAYERLVIRMRTPGPDDPLVASGSLEASDPRLSPWAVVAVLGLLAAGGWYRRRAARPAVPDFVPEELVRDAQVPSRQPMSSSGR